MKNNTIDKETRNRVVAICSIFGAIIGGIITYFIWRQK